MTALIDDGCIPMTTFRRRRLPAAPVHAVLEGASRAVSGDRPGVRPRRLAQQHRPEPPEAFGYAKSGAQGLLAPEVAEERASEPGIGGPQKERHDGEPGIDEPEGDHPPDVAAIGWGLVRLAIAGDVGAGAGERQTHTRGGKK